jgi:hypothetical protein
MLSKEIIADEEAPKEPLAALAPICSNLFGAI